MTDQHTPLAYQAKPTSIGVLFALPEERKPFCAKPFPSGLCIACSGAGVRNAAHKTAQILAEQGDSLRMLLVCGFTGGLSPDLKPGDLVVANCVQDETEQADSPSETFWMDSALLTATESISLPGISVQVGKLATTDRVLIHPEEKRALATRTGAIAVDMETAGAVRIARKKGIPCLVVRAVTDGLEDSLPLDFNAFTDETGNVHRGKVVAATLIHPWKIPALIRLGQRSTLAAKNLSLFLHALLASLLDIE